MKIGLEYRSLMGPRFGSFTLNLVMGEEETSISMASYVAVLKEAMSKIYPALKPISEDFLTTEDGKEYFRWVFNNSAQGMTLRQIYYLYDSGNWKLSIVYTRLSAQGAENDALVDAAMKTVRFERK